MPQVWIITGSSSGFGRAIAEAALQRGDTVVATARRPENVSVTAGSGQLHPMALDVTDASRIPAAVGEVIERFGRVDVLVNNAGRAQIGAAEETTDEELRDLMDVHFFGPVALTRAVLPHMRQQGTGAIVQISSMGGRMSFAGCSAYSATKFALEGFSEALADEVRTFGIKVLIVEPGAFRTGLHGDAMQMSAELPAYADVIEPVRTAMRGYDAAQPGDPAKAAAAIISALDAERTPLRLPLGNDAADAVRSAADRFDSDFVTWERTIRGTDIDQ
jgi:NAD(P)-dependent dehydrogenase (short-subunit alcohol dehydrogenase family)